MPRKNNVCLRNFFQDPKLLEHQFEKHPRLISPRTVGVRLTKQGSEAAQQEAGSMTQAHSTTQEHRPRERAPTAAPGRLSGALTWMRHRSAAPLGTLRLRSAARPPAPGLSRPPIFHPAPSISPAPKDPTGLFYQLLVCSLFCTQHVVYTWSRVKMKIPALLLSKLSIHT